MPFLVNVKIIISQVTFNWYGKILNEWRMYKSHIHMIYRWRWERIVVNVLSGKAAEEGEGGWEEQQGKVLFLKNPTANSFFLRRRQLL